MKCKLKHFLLLVPYQITFENEYDSSTNKLAIESEIGKKEKEKNKNFKVKTAELILKIELLFIAFLTEQGTRKYYSTARQ